MGVFGSKPASESADSAGNGDQQVEQKPKGISLDDHFALKRHLDEVATDVSSVVHVDLRYCMPTHVLIVHPRYACVYFARFSVKPWFAVRQQYYEC